MLEKKKKKKQLGHHRKSKEEKNLHKVTTSSGGRIATDTWPLANVVLENTVRNCFAMSSVSKRTYDKVNEQEHSRKWNGVSKGNDTRVRSQTTRCCELKPWEGLLFSWESQSQSQFGCIPWDRRLVWHAYPMTAPGAGRYGATSNSSFNDKFIHFLWMALNPSSLAFCKELANIHVQ